MSHAKLRICAAFKLHQPQGILPLRRPHVGALHVVLVGSRAENLGPDLLEIEKLLQIGSMVCGNFGGAPLEAIQTRKKLAALTVVTSAPEGPSAAHIFAGRQLEVRRVICVNALPNFQLSPCSLEG